VKTEFLSRFLDEVVGLAEEVGSTGPAHSRESDVSLDRSRTDDEGLDVLDELVRERKSSKRGSVKSCNGQRVD